MFYKNNILRKELPPTMEVLKMLEIDIEEA